MEVDKVQGGGKLRVRDNARYCRSSIYTYAEYSQSLSTTCSPLVYVYIPGYKDTPIVPLYSCSLLVYIYIPGYKDTPIVPLYSCSLLVYICTWIYGYSQHQCIYTWIYGYSQSLSTPCSPLSLESLSISIFCSPPSLSFSIKPFSLVFNHFSSAVNNPQTLV